MESVDTIVACATPFGKSALAIIRICGPHSHVICSQCIENSSVFNAAHNRYLGLYTIINPNNASKIDQITAIKYGLPSSFTGEDMVEIVCHGGPIIIEEILAALIICGARYAEHGEFSRRALMNGKLNLMKAESIHELINSNSRAQRSAAIHSYFGGYQKVIIDFKAAIKAQLINIEAIIEFPEEDDISEKSETTIIDAIKQLIKTVQQEIENRSRMKANEKGVSVVLAGKRNAGKSTLFNFIVGSERSIVHATPGTTRDFINESMIINGRQISIIDTAGIGNPTDAIESMGICRAKELIKSSDLIIWVTAADEEFDESENEILAARNHQNVIAVINKADCGDGRNKLKICDQHNISHIVCSLKEHDKDQDIIAFFEAAIERIPQEIIEKSFLLNPRHEQLAQRILEELKNAELNSGGMEIIAPYLKRALEYLAELAGETTNDDVLNAIFSEFCIGK